ncbi:MAG TPA: hypothetical protein VII23_25025, partial [Terriglobales bacterium]
GAVELYVEDVGHQIPVLADHLRDLRSGLISSSRYLGRKMGLLYPLPFRRRTIPLGASESLRFCSGLSDSLQPPTDG